MELDLSNQQEEEEDDGIEAAANLERSMDEKEILRNLEDYDLKNYRDDKDQIVKKLKLPEDEPSNVEDDDTPRDKRKQLDQWLKESEKMLQ